MALNILRYAHMRLTVAKLPSNSPRTRWTH